jgi:hypothetical protein
MIARSSLLVLLAGMLVETLLRRLLKLLLLLLQRLQRQVGKVGKADVWLLSL